MSPIKLYDVVRVTKLLRPIEDYNPWCINKRAPQIGDTGTFIEFLHAPKFPEHYVVEMSDTDGSDIWLSEILKDEIEPI